MSRGRQIIVNFNVGYYDDFGNLVVGLRAARRHYLRRLDGFLLDVAAIAPYELLAFVVPHKLISNNLLLIHMLRWIQVTRFLHMLQSKINVKYVMLFISR